MYEKLFVRISIMKIQNVSLKQAKDIHLKFLSFFNQIASTNNYKYNFLAIFLLYIIFF